MKEAYTEFQVDFLTTGYGLGTAPHTVTVYNRATIKYIYIINIIQPLPSGGQYPRRFCGLVHLAGGG